MDCKCRQYGESQIFILSSTVLPISYAMTEMVVNIIALHFITTYNGFRLIIGIVGEILPVVLYRCSDHCVHTKTKNIVLFEFCVSLIPIILHVLTFFQKHILPLAQENTSTLRHMLYSSINVCIRYVYTYIRCQKMSSLYIFYDSVAVESGKDSRNVRTECE